MERYGGQPGHPSFCNEKEWGDWDEYYHYTSTVLGKVANGFGYEVCDCSRPKDAEMDTIREYRTLHINFLDKKCGDAYLTPRLGSAEGKMRDFLTLSYHQIFRYPDPVTAGQDTLKYYENSYRQQPASLFIFNMGLHINHLGAEYNTTLSTILESGIGMKEKHNTHMMWKTTTNADDLRDSEIHLATLNNYTLYDVGKIVSNGDKQGLLFQWDSWHFLPFVYEQINDVLLNYLCKDSQ